MKLKTTATPSKLLATNARLQEVPGLCQHLLDRWHWSPAPGDPLTPTSELANPLAAEQASMQVHRLYHAARALPKSLPVTAAAFEEARHHKKLLVSSDHRPPTSPTMTTRRALPFPRHNSGYVLTLSFLAAHRAAPSVKSAPRLCVPWSASWHPPNNVSPSATTSKRTVGILWR